MNRTRVVRWLRVLLPLAALAMLSTLFLFSRGGDSESQIPYADVDAQAMARDPRLVSPEYAGVTDDGAALQAAMNAAAMGGKQLVIGEGSFRTTIPLVLPGGSPGLTMRGAILYDGPAGQAALTLGDGAGARNRSKVYRGLRVLRASLSDWGNEGDIGLLLRNLDASLVEIQQVEGFTIGARTLGDATGFEDSTLHLGRFVNNRIGLDIHTGSAAGWNNSIRYLGGHFANATGTRTTLDRYGIRFSCEAGAYNRHNAHLFMGPAFELQRQGTPGTVSEDSAMDVATTMRCSAV